MTHLIRQRHAVDLLIGARRAVVSGKVWARVAAEAGLGARAIGAGLALHGVAHEHAEALRGLVPTEGNGEEVGR